jgi:predicted nuclease of predicted toxin-antitoxin system
MRLLIDECIDERLRHFFPGHDCQTAHYAALAGLKKGSSVESGIVRAPR